MVIALIWKCYFKCCSSWLLLHIFRLLLQFLFNKSFYCRVHYSRLHYGLHCYQCIAATCIVLLRMGQHTYRWIDIFALSISSMSFSYNLKNTILFGRNLLSQFFLSVSIQNISFIPIFSFPLRLLNQSFKLFTQILHHIFSFFFITRTSPFLLYIRRLFININLS